MKHFLLAALIAASLPAFAGDETKTETFAVNGDCGMCEETIEKVAMMPGVSKADWDADAKTLVLTYDSEKVSPQTVLQNIAEKGYDSEKFRASDASYNALPRCCQYDRKAIATPQAK